MAFTVKNLANPSGDPVYYDPTFRTVIETHLDILASPPMAKNMPITPDKVYQYEGDFYGLLSELGVQPHLHWIFLRVNGMYNPNEFGMELHDDFRREYDWSLIVPSTDLIRDLRQLHTTTN